MLNFNVTSADLQVVLKVAGLYDDGVILEGFSVDSAITADAVDISEVRRGVDGHIVAGVIKNPYPVSIVLEANSPSLDYMETIRDDMQSSNEPRECTLTINYPSMGTNITFVHGTMTSAAIIPPAQRTLQPTTWGFMFESVKKN